MNVQQSRNMVGVIKKFDCVDHKNYDNKGKEALIKYLNVKFDFDGYSTIENSDRHGIDVLTLNNDKKVIACWEVEVRYGNWPNDSVFPFDKINCIERKDYLWRKDEELLNKIPHPVHPGLKVYYVQLNKLCTRGVIIDGEDILKYPLKPWTNRKAEGEYVRQVPILCCKEIDLLWRTK